MKRWFSGLLAAVMVLLLLPASASGTESFYAYLYSNPTTAVGETALVGLYLGQNSTSQEYNTYFFQIDYDAESLLSRVPLSAAMVISLTSSTTTLTLDC